MSMQNVTASDTADLVLEMFHLGHFGLSVLGRWSTYLEQTSCKYSGNQTLPAFKKQLKLYLIGNPEH